MDSEKPILRNKLAGLNVYTSFTEAVNASIPSAALFMGNASWPANNCDPEGKAQLESLMSRFHVGPPGTMRDKPKSEQPPSAQDFSGNVVGLYWLEKTPSAQRKSIPKQPPSGFTLDPSNGWELAGGVREPRPRKPSTLSPAKAELLDPDHELAPR